LNASRQYWKGRRAVASGETRSAASDPSITAGDSRMSR
jgi:hypothetical protein